MVYVEYENVCVAESRSDEAYGDWSMEFAFSVKRVVLSTNPSRTSYDSFNIPFEKGETCYVVSYTYSDGDSFGYSSGNGEVAMVYRNLENAQFAKGVIEDNNDNNLKMHIPFELPDGSIEIMDIGNPMYDYFTHLEAVHIDSFIVQ